jgi:hypothetical protein
MKYMIVSEQLSFRLTAKVDELINSGWELVGGISVASSHSGALVFTQALVKKG